VFFSHIYIESEIQNHSIVKRILARFPAAEVVEINHYKDVFCRSRQNYGIQKNSPSLILAGKQQNLVYEGAPVCQSFGNSHFYYTSSVMNCIYDCEYCYLQGMYPSANMVVFVNLEDIFEQVEILLKKHPVYLCVSYDTDLLALENILGYTERWFDFASKQQDLTIEVRTKSANISVLDRCQPLENVILAWTLSPQRLSEAYEQHVPSFRQRLDCIKRAISKGFKVRLCFDPMIYCSDWKQQYSEMINIVFEQLPADCINDISVGVFRIPQDYLKRMRKQAPASEVIQFPFENDSGVYHYGTALTNEMLSFACDLLKTKGIAEEKIFVWESVN
jgi:spore photoproduct lyase